VQCVKSLAPTIFRSLLLEVARLIWSNVRYFAHFVDVCFAATSSKLCNSLTVYTRQMKLRLTLKSLNGY